MSPVAMGQAPDDKRDAAAESRAGRGVWVVAACFNEAEGIEAFIAAIRRQPEVEHLLLVDDGSRDATTAVIRRCLAEQGADASAGRPSAGRPSAGCSLGLIELTRNFGKEAAMLAGLDFARGRCEAVILIDADLQHPPDLIGPMVRAWQQGAEMVTAVRDSDDQESRLKIASASGFYRLFNRLVPAIQLTDGAGDYRLLSRPVVEALTRMRENSRFSKGLLPWTGFRSVNLTYRRERRQSGRSAWNFGRLWNYALDGIFSFSVVPLRVWAALGLLVSALSLLYALILIITTLVQGVDVPGYASLIVAVLFLGGIQLIGIGILGEYIGRIYVESKRRPPYFVRAITPAPEGLCAEEGPAAAGASAEGPSAPARARAAWYSS